MSEFNVVLYSEIGFGRQDPSHQQTVVYKGRLHNSVEFVAAKLIDNQRQDETFKAVEILHKFDHGNIVRFINWYQTSAKTYVILEYCPGGTLLELLERDVCLPESVIRIFSSDILSALLYVHKKGFLYRDFSPRNILLDECGILKLGDFSLAGKVGDLFDLSCLDSELIELLPPELLCQKAKPTFASDLYSLGCLMYKMAIGAVPFLSEDPDELVSLIKTTQPELIPDVSPECNDLILKLLAKDPKERPTWGQILKHPFWKDALVNRLDDCFKQYDPNSLPHQPECETPAPSPPPSFRGSQKMVLNSPPPEPVVETVDVIELLTSSQLLKPAGVVYNQSIETYPLAPFDQTAIPITVESLKASNSEGLEMSISKLRAALNGPDRPKIKAGFLSFLIANAKTPDAANNLLNSSLFPELILQAQGTKHPSLSAGFLLLYGTILRYADLFDAARFPPESLAPLEDLAGNSQEKIARKAVATIGQLVSNIAAGSIDIPFPSFAPSVILKSLKVADEPVRHYALRTLSNLLIAGKLQGVLTAAQIEPLLLNIDLSQSPLLLETHFVCLAAFFKAHRLSTSDLLSTVLKNVVTRGLTANLQTLAIIIASETGLLVPIKEQVIAHFKTANGELKLKAFLSLCTLAKSAPAEFIEVAPRFFQFLEKTQSDASFEPIYDAVTKWSCQFCEAILDGCLKAPDWDLLQIAYQVMQIRPLFARLWTPRFEKKLHRLIRSDTFTNAKSEVIVQLVQCAICYQQCDLAVLSDLCRPLNSQHESVRFSAVKLVADLSSQPSAPLLQFAESNVIANLGSLLQDVPEVVDQTLRIAANVCAQSPKLLPACGRLAVLSAVFARIPDNSAALQLATQVILAGVASLDTLLGARLIPALIGVMDRQEHGEAAVELLAAALAMVWEQVSDAKQGSARKNLMRAVHSLSAVAPKVAARILDYPKAAACVCLILKVFTPQGRDADVLLESSYAPIATAIVQGHKKPEYALLLGEVLRALQWSAEVSAASRLRLKGATKLMAAVRKAAEQGCDDLKTAAIAFQRAVADSRRTSGARDA